jgi:hypothetical protein
MEVGEEAAGVGLVCLGVTCGCLASFEVGEEAEVVGLGCLGVTFGCLASVEVGEKALEDRLNCAKPYRYPSQIIPAKLTKYLCSQVDKLIRD